jgi:hypothetical protein
MGFPRAIAEAQRKSFVDRCTEQAKEIETIREMLAAGEPHLFDMSPAKFLGTLSLLDRVARELRTVGS